MSNDESFAHADAELNAAALTYHAEPTPGKTAIEIKKPASTQRDLSLAYTPGVAEPVRRIAEDPAAAYRYTNKGNLVAVITDGSAVLGLGGVGPLASKPVMEGKAVLFKHFADIDVFDIEVYARHPQEFIDTVRRIAPTFGGINLEDIAAPHCFEIEQILQEELDIPVFHDDQHGTAIIIAAGLLNALELQQKKLEDARIVVLGAGAAGIAAIRLLITLGAHRNNIFAVDRQGVIHTGRRDLNPYKFGIAADTEKRTLADAMDGADVFIGVSGPDLIPPAMLASMAPRPIVFALSNPVPEIRPEVAWKVRGDMIMATGRSDYPNQVNNVLGFPFIFRGALDARATRINEEMQIAAVHALKDLTHEPVPQSVLDAYGLDALAHGPEYIIPKPFDPRLRGRVAPAVAAAAVRSGVAQAPAEG
ncbi:malic enzyme-like NAD(P)-binding protein [Thiohalocapsa sp. ML1]|jgi:malate dehydrogenase (oxaloacetate-decarboxylating)(NADP+)|uniref:malic enzyme-like NAD(P)-binding protein n=1 Tax=Thiohalocapsa sp. ML1 TaxID=1431688 RepID=UPI0007323A49|nr:malic enzyme-like NAD(P)-binding protein [Thiohalocapsa sp. ML1]